MIIGYHASHEQFTPRDLVHYARLAEASGFDAVMSSDHFAPWSEAQGQSGFALSWLGAAMQATTTIPFGLITVPCGWRYHPAITAQAAATICDLFPTRFPWLAVGSGERLNEHVVGQGWPAKAERNERLVAAVSIMRRLWNGETVTEETPIPVDAARLFTLPPKPPAVIAGVLSAETARWAGGWADGLITVNQCPSSLHDILSAFDEGGGAGKPRFLQLHLSYGATLEEASLHAFRQWKSNAINADTAENTGLTEDFDRLSADVSITELEKHVQISANPRQHADMIAAYAALGFDEIYLHNVGTNQAEFIEVFGRDVLPKLR
ncbi:LLM class F420-dependent oxidoreductase [Brucella endophytica]|uniref:LLM class F420-dependent oxidoreductase n=2 Tax=Brucella endophytica TaxID=1963359 RepID=A0A916W9C3_9HYPH|nr:LLM class F420-dependent oxidoreductase [Brucella endophytica]